MAEAGGRNQSGGRRKGRGNGTGRGGEKTPQSKAPRTGARVSPQQAISDKPLVIDVHIGTTWNKCSGHWTTLAARKSKLTTGSNFEEFMDRMKEYFEVAKANGGLEFANHELSSFGFTEGKHQKGVQLTTPDSFISDMEAAKQSQAYIDSDSDSDTDDGGGCLVEFKVHVWLKLFKTSGKAAASGKGKGKNQRAAMQEKVTFVLRQAVLRGETDDGDTFYIAPKTSPVTRELEVDFSGCMGSAEQLQHLEDVIHQAYSEKYQLGGSDGGSDYGGGGGGGFGGGAQQEEDFCTGLLPGVYAAVRSTSVNVEKLTPLSWEIMAKKDRQLHVAMAVQTSEDQEQPQMQEEPKKSNKDVRENGWAFNTGTAKEYRELYMSILPPHAIKAGVKLTERQLQRWAMAMIRGERWAPKITADMGWEDIKDSHIPDWSAQENNLGAVRGAGGSNSDADFEQAGGGAGSGAVAASMAKVVSLIEEREARLAAAPSPPPPLPPPLPASAPGGAAQATALKQAHTDGLISRAEWTEGTRKALGFL
jgi:hypothetical protein